MLITKPGGQVWELPFGCGTSTPRTGICDSVPVCNCIYIYIHTLCALCVYIYIYIYIYIFIHAWVEPC